jgi:exopolyphosphatase/guanosine-5'-triphosphate,3'-diphosphate pyrophosphatase
VRRACIDIGSNTTRLLVAECDREGLRELHQERAFTRLGRDVLQSGGISPEKIREVAGVVECQLRLARDLGAERVAGVATAAIRGASNGMELVEEIRRRCGLQIEILGAEKEARLAFFGAARTLGRVPGGTLGVVDVGGGSSELVVGTAPDQVKWCASLRVGSGNLADRCLHSDPPSAAELSAARGQVASALERIESPRPQEAVAVGGSAASLRRLAGPLLDDEAFERSLALLGSQRAAQVAQRFELAVERVRLLPAGLLILQGAAEAFGSPLEVGRGGVREGVLLTAVAA